MFENIKDERILITGGTGFLGNYVVRELILQGVKPTVLTRDLHTKVFENQGKEFNLAEVDLLDTPALKSLLEKFRPRIIIHLAGYTHKKENQTDVLEKFNFEATAKLLDLAQEIKVKRIIITGTADEYGFQPSPQTETMPKTPVSEYAVSKNKAINHALSLYEKFSLPVVILRPFTVYGIGQPAKMFVSQAVECAVRGIPFEMSKGEQKRDLLFVSDFVDAIIKVLQVRNIEGETFNVGSGKAIALNKLAEKIWAIAGADKKLLKIGARFTKENELHNTEADITKIKNVLKWEPKISLDEGLGFVIEKAKKDLK